MNDTGAGPILILGGRSEIGVELARRLAPGATVVLAARHADRLDEQVTTLKAAGAAAVHTEEFDADDLASHGPLVAAVVEGPDAIVQWRALMGATNPVNAAPGTIRGDLATVTQNNVTHGSDSPESAAREIALWFPGLTR